MQADATFWDSLVFDGIDDLDVESVTDSPATRRVRSERVTHKASVERYRNPGHGRPPLAPERSRWPVGQGRAASKRGSSDSPS